MSRSRVLARKPKTTTDVSISIRTESESETVTCLQLAGPNLFVANYTNRPFDFEDLVRAAQVGANDSADTPRDLDWHLKVWDLQPTLDATSQLLIEMFGSCAKVFPRLAEDRETGAAEIVFDLITPQRPSFEERDRFLDDYVAKVPGAVGPDSPILMWNPTST